MVLPEITPGEPTAAPSAAAPPSAANADTGTAIAIAPEAAATAMTPFRVTRFIGFPAFQTWSRALARTG
ncbi:hypothetical protein GCM10010508_11850 [Streptomyces naganishii JCM 4654]|uniref:Uncharacterized protein n=1 Tax=Streptomyces naganishii JCM 4654 TaxID=1306179 RepID=A0A919CV86_9ACTN|nr:hypothetical protein GCM10010508_11850 [Streptomyces naganishii JCM 4654]